MGRARLGVFTALTLTLAGRAGAAEITRVASRGDPGNPFDLHVTLRWDRSQERAQITREVPGSDDGDELRYTRTVNTVVPRVALGITDDLELHVEWPYVLGDDRTRRYGLGPAPLSAPTIETNAVDASGASCGAAPCPLFAVEPEKTVYLGGRGGDLEAGIAWNVFDQREDATKPTWLVGFDVTFPTAARYDPAAGRFSLPPAWASPHEDPGKPAPVGEKVWKWDLQTVLSRRMGSIEPYVKAHLTLMSKSSSTYSNCEHAAEMSAYTEASGRPVAQMVADAATRCAAQGSDADAKLPRILGLTIGAELVPYENDAEQQRVAVDFRLFADHTSSQRFYNELTDASGKLHWTDEYLTMGGFFGLYLRASQYVSLQATASLSTSTPHWLSGEASPENANYDARYDAAGQRFRISEVANFAFSFGGVLTF